MRAPVSPVVVHAGGGQGASASYYPRERRLSTVPGAVGEKRRHAERDALAGRRRAGRRLDRMAYRAEIESGADPLSFSSSVTSRLRAR